MNQSQPLVELARYLESQIPGADASREPARPAQPATSASSTPEPPPIELAAALFERQLALNSASAALLARDGTPRCRAIRTLADIPAVPVVAFKQLELTTVTPLSRVAEFHSSGTTDDKPSRHFHSEATLQIYRLALEAWFKRRMLGDFPWAWQHPTPKHTGRIPMISLSPSPTEAPHSSLAFMIGTLIELHGTAESAFTGRAGPAGWELDFPATLKALRTAQDSGRPAVVLGTAFNFVHLIDRLETDGETVRLPPGSRVMETGGYKGRSRAVEKPVLHALIAARLGVSPGRIVCEYGMSELSSQAYDLDLTTTPTAGDAQPARRFQFPPWCHVSVVSPETGRPLPDGQPGLLRVVDLANVASVLALQTEDLAVLHEDGFELLGRATRAEQRGCSLLPVDG